jgi:peptidyl-prolyl cis-trans isomerase B (cyclophilin B)
MRKRLITALLLALLLPFLSTPMASAEKKLQTKKSDIDNSKASKKLKCQATSAISRTPEDVPIPERVLTTRQIKKSMREIVIDTNCGQIVISPLHRHARVTLTALSTLIKAGFYKKSLCHRLTTSGFYVLQCGDPTATGRGGPNFTYGVENLPSDKEGNYPAGVVAMANSGTSNSNGSQFFIVYQESTLPANYTIWGRVKKGLNVVKLVAQAGVRDGSGDGAPKQPIAIETIYTR